MASSARSAKAWAELASRLQQVVTDGGYDLHVAGRRGLRDAKNGPPSAQAAMRLFGKDESQVRVTLFRDNHAWCPYCHKVWMQLEEKHVPYKVEKVAMNCYGAKSRSFLKKTPRGLLPAIEIDGRFTTESSTIMQLIESTFPEQSLTPHGTDQLMSLERELFGAWLNWLRGEESARASATFERAVDATESVLKRSGGPYFAGRSFSLADCVFASSLERIVASILYYKGLQIRNGRWPCIEAWFRAMESRESYMASRSDYHTHVHDLPPQIGGCIASGTPKQKAAAAAIDGMDGHSWHLPLPPLTMESLEPGMEDPVKDRFEAAFALIHCREGIINSSQGDEAAHSAFQVVAQALIDGVEKFQASSSALKTGDINPAAAFHLRHTRDRICVPRDMSFAAARQLRAHLNWAADTIDPPKQAWVGVPIASHDRRDSDPAVFGLSTL